MFVIYAAETCYSGRSHLRFNALIGSADRTSIQVHPFAKEIHVKEATRALICFLVYFLGSLQNCFIIVCFCLFNLSVSMGFLR